jgi:hypothetical protein
MSFDIISSYAATMSGGFLSLIAFKELLTIPEVISPLLALEF